MYAIGLRRGLAGIALALTAFTGLVPITPTDPLLLEPESLFVVPKSPFYAPPPYILEVPSDLTLSQ